jgi:NitT/TauT family transport system substrate-binding protein
MKLALPDMISNSYFPAMAAVELGFFAKEGLAVSLELMSPADKAYRALAEEQVDFVGAEAHAALAVFPNWRGMKLVCALAQGMYWFLVMRADIGARRGQLDSVRGRRIGAAPWVELGLRRLLIEAGIDPIGDNVSIVPIPGSLGLKVNTGVTAAQALEDGLIDGFWANGMGAEIAVRRGVGTIVLDVRRGDGPKSAFDYTFAALAASDRLIESRPNAIAAAKRAIAAAHGALKQDVALAAAVGHKLFPAEEAKLITDLVRRDLPFYDSSISEHAVACLNRFACAVGLLDANPGHLVAEIVSEPVETGMSGGSIRTTEAGARLPQHVEPGGDLSVQGSRIR